ncbi:DUF4369 domain-containing protein [Geofilum sp. OHC36d9]|uniref:DUF4369 domain-containing protein n=1 Tax=Geofilum sp. OHC36d9 TaxID=3458413 RepID=UPI004033266D
MKWFIFFLFCFFGCSDNYISYTVQGTVPNVSFSGEYIYLFPFNNNDLSMLDSVLVVDRSFVYHGLADSVYMMVVRARNPNSRFELEDMLFITQPGDITINLSESSFVSGTPLNDSIQKWKDGKDIYREKLMKMGDDATVDSNVKGEIIEFHYQMALNNKGNPFGRFVVSMMGNLFSEEQLSELSQ